jgi:hypothetical protein
MSRTRIICPPCGFPQAHCECEYKPAQHAPLRMWTEDDYPMLQTWWEGHGWPAVPQRILPPLGVIFENSAAGWMYLDNGGVGVAFIEWLVTNPKAAPRTAVAALVAVVTFLKSEARRLNYPFILSTCKQEGLARLLEKAGFQRTDSGMIHLLSVQT